MIVWLGGQDEPRTAEQKVPNEPQTRREVPRAGLVTFRRKFLDDEHCCGVRGLLWLKQLDRSLQHTPAVVRKDRQLSSTVTAARR